MQKNFPDLTLSRFKKKKRGDSEQLGISAEGAKEGFCQYFKDTE